MRHFNLYELTVASMLEVQAWDQWVWARDLPGACPRVQGPQPLWAVGQNECERVGVLLPLLVPLEERH